MKDILYGGLTDVGINRELNEDYISISELGDDAIFVAVADGAGSKNGLMLQPASIAIREVFDVISRVYDKNPELVKDNAELVLYEAMMTANRVLSAFKIANEELYAGFGSTLTACLIFNDGQMDFCHIGNCQLLLLRQNKDKTMYIPKILSVEQTKAYEQMQEGIIREDLFPTHPDRMVITGALGLYTDPVIQTFEVSLRSRDFIIITTDGVHYAIRPEMIGQIVLEADNCDNAVAELIKSAKHEKFSDNMSAVVVFNARK